MWIGISERWTEEYTVLRVHQYRLRFIPPGSFENWGGDFITKRFT